MAQKFRHELKYYITQGDYLLLSNRLARTLRRDPHAGETGDYHVRSLYFDNIHNTAIHQKLDGLELRRKTRIRIYNFSDDKIRLESKEKRGPYISKQTIMLSRKACDTILAGDPRCLLRARSEMGPQIYALMRGELLQPTVIVDYAREAYIHPLEDVRITFDKNLRTGMLERSLFDPNTRTLPVLEDNAMIMEVKFNRFLPDYVASLLQLERVQRSALSKYVLCRRYEA